MQNKQDKLSEYGYSFQVKIISGFLSDVNFISSIYDILELDFFESEAIKFLVDTGLTYFKQYKRLPTLDVYKIHLKKIDDELLKKEIVSCLRDVVKNINSSDIDYVKQSTIDFCKNQKVKEAILKSVNDLQQGNYDAIRSRIDLALKVGVSNDLGHDYADDVERRYTENSRNVISTGWGPVDGILKGGHGSGELGVVIAPSGAGKSFILTHIGAAALKENKKVVHYTLELDAESIGKRYDAMLTGISLTKLTSNLSKEYISEVGSRIEKYKKKLYIKKFPMKGVSLMGIRAHLQKLSMYNFIPDLIIIDYADLLKYSLTNNMAKHDALEMLYEEIRGLAGELDVPIWTVSQTTRSSREESVIEGNSISAAYSKIFPADFVASLSRKAQDRMTNTGRLHIIKNRNGPDGLTFPVFMDTGRAIINVYDVNTDEGQKLSGKMQTNDEYEKSKLRERYNQLRNKNNKGGSF